MTLKVTLLRDDSVIHVDMTPCVARQETPESRVNYFIPKSQLTLMETTKDDSCPTNFDLMCELFLEEGEELFITDEDWHLNYSPHEKEEFSRISAGSKRAYRIVKALLAPAVLTYNTYWIKTAFLHIHSASSDRTAEPACLLAEIIKYLVERIGLELEGRSTRDMERQEYATLRPFFNPSESLLSVNQYHSEPLRRLRETFENWLGKCSDASSMCDLVDFLLGSRDRWISGASTPERSKSTKFMWIPRRMVSMSHVDPENIRTPLADSRHVKAASGGTVAILDMRVRRNGEGQIDSTEPPIYKMIF